MQIGRWGMVQDDTTASYAYTADGLRRSKTVNGVTTSFVLDGMYVAAETSGETSTCYSRGVNLISRSTGGSKDYYYMNSHGDATKLVNSSGAVVADYTYDAFGNQTEEAEDSNPFRYAGEYWDSESGLIYLRARYYDAGVGGFTSADTHWNVGNMIYGDDNTGIPSIAAIMQSGNLYVYCGSNPVNRIDIAGFEWGYIRDFANDLTMIFGGSPNYNFGYGGVRVTVGGGYYQKSGMFYFDGWAEVKRYGGRSTSLQLIAQNINGRLYMDRQDFYKVMGVNYEVLTSVTTVTDLGNLGQSLTIGSLVTAATAGFEGLGASLLFGAASTLADFAISKHPGDYKTICTVAYVQSSIRSDTYDTIITVEVYYKAPEYNDYASDAVFTKTFYGGYYVE